MAQRNIGIVPFFLFEKYPYPPNYFEVSPGIKQHFVDVGVGQPMLFLHGNPTWSFYFRDLINHFSKRFRCIALDHIGCGLSSKPENYSYTLETHIKNAQAVVQHLDLQDITLCVHDWGGPIGFGLAERELSRISRIVVFNTACFFMPTVPWYLRLCHLPLFGEVLVRGLNLFLHSTINWGTTDKARLKTLAPWYFFPYRDYKSRRAILEFVRDIPLRNEHCSFSALSEIEVRLSRLDNLPMDIYWGMKDPVFTPEVLSIWRSKFPKAIVREFPSAGHLVVEDATQEIIKDLDLALSS